MKKWVWITAQVLIGALSRKSDQGVWITNELPAEYQNTLTSFALPMRLSSG